MSANINIMKISIPTQMTQKEQRNYISKLIAKMSLLGNGTFLPGFRLVEMEHRVNTLECRQY